MERMPVSVEGTVAPNGLTQAQRAAVKSLFHCNCWEGMMLSGALH